jgi:hypothetical protein
MEQARGLLADAHHGLREGEAIGHANALAHVYKLAEACGATSKELNEIRSGFPLIAQALLAERRGRRSKRLEDGAAAPPLPPLPIPPELPPGS